MHIYLVSDIAKSLAQLAFSICTKQRVSIVICITIFSRPSHSNCKVSNLPQYSWECPLQVFHRRKVSALPLLDCAVLTLECVQCQLPFPPPRHTGFYSCEIPSAWSNINHLCRTPQQFGPEICPAIPGSRIPALCFHEILKSVCDLYKTTESVESGWAWAVQWPIFWFFPLRISIDSGKRSRFIVCRTVHSSLPMYSRWILMCKGSVTIWLVLWCHRWSFVIYMTLYICNAVVCETFVSLSNLIIS